MARLPAVYGWTGTLTVSVVITSLCTDDNFWLQLSLRWLTHMVCGDKCSYVGHLKERTVKEQMVRDSTEVIRKAVLRMLPRNKLRDVSALLPVLENELARTFCYIYWLQVMLHRLGQMHQVLKGFACTWIRFWQQDSFGNYEYVCLGMRTTLVVQSWILCCLHDFSNFYRIGCWSCEFSLTRTTLLTPSLLINLWCLHGKSVSSDHENGELLPVLNKVPHRSHRLIRL